MRVSWREASWPFAIGRLKHHDSFSPKIGPASEGAGRAAYDGLITRSLHQRCETFHRSKGDATPTQLFGELTRR